MILGAAGDLTGRLLLPGLGALVARGGLDGLRLIGSGLHDWDDDRWRERVRESFNAAQVTGDEADAVAAGATYRQAEASDEDDLRRLLDDATERVAIFFALPPQVTVSACEALRRVGVPPDTRLVLEKPFGSDSASARSLNETVTRLVPEDQVHRVDHYLGMSTVLNILGLRFANRMFEPVLNADHVHSVEIVFDESLALEARAGYYDSAGALVDMIQSHALQVLALLAMDVPASITAGDLRDRKAEVLRVTRVWDGDPGRFSSRGRYTAGLIGDRRVPSYVEEEGVDPSRGTETFAEVVLAVDNDRWVGVPFRARTAKAVAATRKEAVFTFKEPVALPAGLTGYQEPDRLHVGFEPDLIAADVNINGPGDPATIERVRMHAGFPPGDLPPYGEVLSGVFAGDPTLSVRGDTAVECWRIVEPVLDAWRAGQVPLQDYTAGSTGPEPASG